MVVPMKLDISITSILKTILTTIVSIGRRLARLIRQIARLTRRTIVVLFTTWWGRLFLGLIFAGILALSYWILKDLPSPRNLTTQNNFAVSSQIFDRDGELLYEIYGAQNRLPVDLEDVPQHMQEATIAIEDQRFYRHHGIDLIGITRALINNIQGKPLEGGSTITQQLIKNALLTRDRTIQRKAKEAILAIVTELIYSKEEILEMYLNYVAYGGTAVGVEAASQQYFDKSVSELTVAESALLAGLPQAPSSYSPFGSTPERATQRQTAVLDRMVDQGYLTAAAAEDAKATTLDYALSRTDIKAPHFVFYVRDLLYEEYGKERVEQGGLRVTTTLDLDLHTTAQASLSAEIARLERQRVGNGAALITKPNTGEILSMIGSKDYFNTAEDGQVNVTLANRQPGSSIKPLTYATAMELRTLNPGTMLLDIPTCFASTGQPDYCPRNYDGSFRGPVSVRQSLGNSLNIPAVKALKSIGVEPFMEQVNAMGLTTFQDPSRYGLSLTLGGGEVRMIDMAQAFGVLANQGVKAPLTPLLKVESYDGEVLYELDTQQRREDLATLTEYEGDDTAGELERVMERGPAYLTSHIMQDNAARTAAFGSRSELVIPDQIVSVKTGTTNDLKDNWTIGFTTEYLVSVWVGNNDNTPMNQSLVSGVTGAAPIWNDIMSFILRDRDAEWQTKPPSVTSGRVCASGFPAEEQAAALEGDAAESCTWGNEDLYWEDSVPSASRVLRQEVWIDPTTGLPPQEEGVEGLVLEEHSFYQDPVSPPYCGDCNRPTDEDGTPVYRQYVVPQNLQERIILGT